MEYALTADHHRVHAFDAEKGQEYYCPVCGNQVIPRQGEVNSWHFAHVTSCMDDWKYDMSEWHRGWQSRFPENVREIVVEHRGECHRADILMGGYVIEFQHSPISAGEFERRNKFYTRAGYKVIWVFDETYAFGNEYISSSLDDENKFVWKWPNRVLASVVPQRSTDIAVVLQLTEDHDRVELAEEAKAEDYSLLLISMPKIEQDTEFTPDRLQSALQDNDRTEWVFSRLEEQWKQKYYAVAVSPPEHGTGNLCPISFGKYKGKYSARWIDCAHCHFNVAQPPCCLCVAGAGIQKKEDFKRDLQDRLFDIDKIRRTNEEEIRLREERERSFERRSVYPRPTPYAARPVVPAGPTQEELDAEYIRICQSYDPTSDEWTVDRYNRRWIMCTVCGRIKQDAQMSYYGGKGGANRGVCADCSRNGRS